MEAMGSPILRPCSSPHQGRTTPNSHSSDSHYNRWTEPLRPAKLTIHRHSQSLPGHAPQACTGLHDFHSASLRPLGLTNQDPNMHNLRSTGLHPQACTGLHNIHSVGPHPSGLHRPAWSLLIQATPLRPAKPAIHTHGLPRAVPPALHRPAWSLFWQPVPHRPAKPAIHTHSWSPQGHAPQACTGLHNLCQDRVKSAKLAIHRHIWSPLCRPVHFRHARRMLQRPASLPQWKASAIALWGPTHLLPTTEGLQTCLRDTYRQVWMVKE
jgi:hypothetical protein